MLRSMRCHATETQQSKLGSGVRAESRLPEFKRAHNFCRDLVAKKPRRSSKIVPVIWVTVGNEDGPDRHHIGGDGG